MQEGIIVSYSGTRPDGAVFQYSSESRPELVFVDSGTIILTVTSFMTEVYGRFPIDIYLLSDDGDVLGMFNLTLNVARAAITNRKIATLTYKQCVDATVAGIQGFYMQVGEYGITAEEIMAADAIKFYLQSMEPAEALKKVAAVYEPKVIWLDSGEGVPVQSIIDGAKYAAFIDEAVRFAVQEVEDSRIIEKLESIDGKHMIESASVEFMSFIEEAYKCLRW